MAKPTALLKCSSRLLGRPDVIARVRDIEKAYALRFVSGGGEQINAAFSERGWDNTFGPFGRVCESFDQRLVAENVLKHNAASLEDQLQGAGLPAHMVLPVLDSEVGQVTCHVNGDLFPIICYNGYDRFFVFTFDEDVVRKKWYYCAMWQINRLHLANRTTARVITINEDDYPEKIEVVGFPDVAQQ